MIIALSITIYASLVCFAVGCIRRIRRYSTLPMHLRWELYPVPNEDPTRAAYGGSYFEQTDWWTKPRHHHRVGELRAMRNEIFLFESVRRSNPHLWWRSLLFHAGIYCTAVALAINVILALAASDFAAAQTVAAWIARIGLALTFAGSSALLQKRMRDQDLRNSTHFADIAQLVALSIAALAFLVSCMRPQCPASAEVVRAVLKFDTSLSIPTSLALGLMLASFITAYIPYSPMGHFIGKYFAYHAVRWDAEPLGTSLAQRSARNLHFRPTWAASHIDGDGQKTWADLANENPTSLQEAKR